MVKSIEYLQAQTNMTLPIDPKKNATTVYSLIDYVNAAIIIDSNDDPWN